ncbi:hypothetical protein BH23CHL5_BH23CHL5_03410 [soil metagenome]
MGKHTNDSSTVQNDLENWAVVAESGSFEASLESLEAIVALLDRGNLKLDESVEAYELGAKLSQRCQSLLEDAQQRVATLSPSSQYHEGDDVDDPWDIAPE